MKVNNGSAINYLPLGGCRTILKLNDVDDLSPIDDRLLDAPEDDIVAIGLYPLSSSDSRSSSTFSALSGSQFLWLIIDVIA